MGVSIYPTFIPSKTYQLCWTLWSLNSTRPTFLSIKLPANWPDSLLVRLVFFRRFDFFDLRFAVSYHLKDFDCFALLLLLFILSLSVSIVFVLLSLFSTDTSLLSTSMALLKYMQCKSNLVTIHILLNNRSRYRSSIEQLGHSPMGSLTQTKLNLLRAITYWNNLLLHLPIHCKVSLRINKSY